MTVCYTCTMRPGVEGCLSDGEPLCRLCHAARRVSWPCEHLIRQDTGEVIKSHAAEAQDLQEPMPFADDKTSNGSEESEDLSGID